MKKRIMAFALVLVLAMSLCLPAMAANIRTVQTEIYYRKIKIVINDVLISPCDEKGNSTEPFIMNDTTYLPVRAIAGALGLKVGWEPATSTVVLERGGETNYGSGTPGQTRVQKTVTITYRGTNISLDGENVPLINRNGDSVEPFIYNGTNYLPLRVIGEALGLSVEWDGRTDSVIMKGSFNSEDDGGQEDYPYVEKQRMPSETRYLIGYTGYEASFAEYMSIKYSYDSQGRLTQIGTGDGSRSINCTYDAANRLSGAAVNREGIINHHKLSYGENGEINGVYINGELCEGHVVTKDAQGRVIREEFIPDSTGYGIYEYSYDEDGRVATRTRISLYDKSYRGECFYDEQGVLEKIVEYAEDYWGRESLAGTISYTYDEQGNVATEKRVASDGVSLEYEKEFTYDERGRLIKEVEHEYFSYNPGSIIVNEYDYAYDAAGRLVLDKETVIGISDDEDGNSFESILSIALFEYTYDGEGRLIREYWENGQPDQDILITGENKWVYDDKGQLIEEHSCGWDKNGGDGKTLKFYGYNDKGQLISYKMESYYDGEKNGEETESYVYDNEGRLVELRTWKQGGDDIVTSFVYDESGFVIKAEETTNGKLTARETNEYDGEGNLLRSELATLADYCSIVIENSYVSVPKYEQSPYLQALIDEFVAEVD